MLKNCRNFYRRKKHKKEQSQEHLIKSMMHIRFFIRETVNGFRLSSNVQSRAKSIKGCSVDKITNIENKPQYVWLTKNIPGPKALPLLGNWFRFIPYIGEYANADVMTLLRMLHEQYGNIVKLDGLMNRRSCVFLFCPQLCEEMYHLTSTSPMRIALESLHYYRKNRKHIYDGQYGLAVNQGKVWRDVRSKVNPHMMQPQTVTAHITQISEVTIEFIEKIRALRDPKTLELPNNFMNELYKWSLESMCSIALGYRLGCLKPNFAMNSEPQIMINCVQDIFDLMYRLENLPSLWKIYNTRDLKKLFHALDTFNEISIKCIERAKEKLRERTDSIDSQDHSILEKLLRIDEKTAHIMALDMLMAGIDTTGNAAGGLLYYIANNLKTQEKLREEVMSVLPSKTSLVTHDILNRITYTKACIKESMRLFPITIGIQRTMQKDVSIKGYRIPAGLDVIACHALISMESAQFPLPHEYIPERWLRDKTKLPWIKEPHPYAYMPFGYGMRTCIGRRFAEMELETLLLTIIRNFRIEWHHEPLKYKSQITNTIVLPMRFKLIDL
ncbi:Probable cytochrome P450 12a5, mitochondrial [Camponotus japonicus]